MTTHEHEGDAFDAAARRWAAAKRSPFSGLRALVVWTRVNGQRDFPVGGRLISLLADR
jgi:hypothetical protein